MVSFNNLNFINSILKQFILSASDSVMCLYFWQMTKQVLSFDLLLVIL